jgi:hypothetical protein
MSKTQVGGYEFNYELTRIRNAADTIRGSLSKIIEGNPGPQTIIAHCATMALQITTILDATLKLTEIGKKVKKERTKTD